MIELLCRVLRLFVQSCVGEGAPLEPLSRYQMRKTPPRFGICGPKRDQRRRWSRSRIAMRLSSARFGRPHDHRAPMARGLLRLRTIAATLKSLPVVYNHIPISLYTWGLAGTVIRPAKAARDVPPRSSVPRKRPEDQKNTDRGTDRNVPHINHPIPPSSLCISTAQGRREPDWAEAASKPPRGSAGAAK